MSDKAIEFMKELCEQQGVACATVKDGHLLMFKVSHLKAMVEAHADQEDLVIFIKRPDFKN
jgi:hypothetical protein